MLEGGKGSKMMSKALRYFSMAAGILLLAGLAQGSVTSIPATADSNPQKDGLQAKVQHELIMLPYYGVFDDIRFQVEGSTVTLTGEVRRPIVKTDAEHAVANLGEVKKVINQIEVLPLSPTDDALRRTMYRAVYSQSGFEKYANQAVKPIRIIVRNGNVRLVGVVGSELEKIMAGTAARNVPFAFSVTNELTIG